MTSFRYMLVGVFCVLGIVPSALAQEHGSLVGDWTIRVTDQENPSFSANANISYDADKDLYIVDLIAEDTCCDGANYAKVRQSSHVVFEEGEIVLQSKIETFLIRDEERPSISYSPDNFRLVQVDPMVLTGTLNRYTAVEWTKRQQAIS